MTKLTKILLGFTLILVAIPVVFDTVHGYLDVKFDNFYTPCAVNRNELGTWSSYCYGEYKKASPNVIKISNWMMEPFGLSHPHIGLRFALSGRCVKEGSVNPVTNKPQRGRIYFPCNKAAIIVSNLLFGEDASRSAWLRKVP